MNQLNVDGNNRASSIVGFALFGQQACKVGLDYQIVRPSDANWQNHGRKLLVAITRRKVAWIFQLAVVSYGICDIGRWREIDVIKPQRNIRVTTSLVTDDPTHLHRLAAQTSRWRIHRINDQVRQRCHSDVDVRYADADVVGFGISLKDAIRRIGERSDVIEAIGKARGIDSHRLNALHGMAGVQVSEEGKLAEQLVHIGSKVVGGGQINAVHPRASRGNRTGVGEYPSDIKLAAGPGFRGHGDGYNSQIRCWPVCDREGSADQGDVVVALAAIRVHQTWRDRVRSRETPRRSAASIVCRDKIPVLQARDSSRKRWIGLTKGAGYIVGRHVQRCLRD